MRLRNLSEAYESNQQTIDSALTGIKPVSAQAHKLINLGDRTYSTSSPNFCS